MEMTQAKTGRSKMSGNSRKNLRKVHDLVDESLDSLQTLVDVLTIYVEEADEAGELSIAERDKVRSIVLKLDKHMNKIDVLTSEIPDPE